MSRIDLPAHPRILVVALRRLGDVLLATPLTRSLKRAWPQAEIDALVFAGTERILDGNPDIANIVTMPERSGHGQSLALIAKLWRRYDLALATTSGDRPSFFAWAAGQQSVGLFDDSTGGSIKRRAFTRAIPVAGELHRVPEVLRLASAIGIAPLAEVVAPAGATAPAIGGRYAVIHAAPMFRYKQWTREGWRALAAALDGRGFKVVATGGPGEAERRYLDDVWQGANVHRLDGQLSWPQLAALCRAASVFIGPDTSVTHLAAATGCPTVALFGPTHPRLWGPWPVGGLDAPWQAAGRIQRRGNVWLVQNPLPCLPCQNEGCEMRLESYSQCLDELSSTQVLAAVDQALGPGAGIAA